jgi:hypothetical protein
MIMAKLGISTPNLSDYDDIRLDLALAENTPEYKEVQSQIIDFLEFWKRRGPEKSYERVKAEYELKKNFEKISPEAQREILQKFEELSSQPCDFLSIVGVLDNITRR